MLREDAKGSEERLGLQGGVCGKGVLMTDGNVGRKIPPTCGGKGLRPAFNEDAYFAQRSHCTEEMRLELIEGEPGDKKYERPLHHFFSILKRG